MKPLLLEANMRGNEADTASVIGGTSSPAQARPSCVALLITPGGRISHSLLHALRQEFPWVNFVETRNVGDAFKNFEYPIRLILVDETMISVLDSYPFEHICRNGGPLVAAILNNNQCKESVLSSLLSSSVVRAALPMNVRLDIWLSIVQLLLTGAPYMPLSLLDPHLDMLTNRPTEHPGADLENASFNVDTLTDRQLQVLSMVSRGYPNKVIAYRLNVSENTVKVHLHNIIVKLGVRNRTEAAAIYHERQVSLGR
jgi:DNA-binding NarL/FixJ family response regulator